MPSYSIMVPKANAHAATIHMRVKQVTQAQWESR